jgi:hypothetical protein
MYRIRGVDEIILSELLNRRKIPELLGWWTFPSSGILETSVRCSIVAFNGGPPPSSGRPSYPQLLSTNLNVAYDFDCLIEIKW